MAKLTQDQVNKLSAREMQDALDAKHATKTQITKALEARHERNTASGRTTKYPSVALMAVVKGLAERKEINGRVTLVKPGTDERLSAKDAETLAFGNTLRGESKRKAKAGASKAGAKKTTGTKKTATLKRKTGTTPKPANDAGAQLAMILEGNPELAAQMLTIAQAASAAAE